MTYPHKKHLVLSEKMSELKHKINLLQQKQQLSISDMLNKKSKLSTLFFDGLQKVMDFFSSILASSKELPVIGFAMRMIATIPNAMATLTDKKSSIGSKMLAISMLVVTTGLGIAAFILGGTVAAGIGLAFASLGTLIEGVSLVSSIVEKYQAAKAYREKKEFNQLIEKGDLLTLDSDIYKERLEIRALELQNLLNTPNRIRIEQLKEELELINTIRNKRGWMQLSFTKDSPSSKLSKLYQDRNDMLVYLKNIIKLLDKEEVDSKNIDTSKLIELVSIIQHEIAEIDESIEKITEPLHKLKQKNLLTNEAIAKSYTNFALGGGGVIFSTIGLMVLLGTLAAPPIAATLFLGFGIGLATFGLIKWASELYAEKADKKFLKERSKEHEETILEEALDCYEHVLSREYQHEGKCSYSTSLSRVLSENKTKETHLAKAKKGDGSDFKEILQSSADPKNEPPKPQSGRFRY